MCFNGDLELHKTELNPLLQVLVVVVECLTRTNVVDRSRTMQLSQADKTRYKCALTIRWPCNSKSGRYQA